MSSFQEHLLRGIAQRLRSPQFHYVDNSRKYYGSGSAKAMAADKAWFFQNPLPDASTFIQAHKTDIAREVLTKSLLFTLLADKHSRDMLVMVALYRIMGHRFVKFPYYASDAQALRAALSLQCAVQEPDKALAADLARDAFGVGYPLSLYRVSVAGQTVTLYTYGDFLYQLERFPPYRYACAGVTIDVEPGDRVLDCGACFGDTALMFAAKAGEEGQVLSFEPHPGLSRLFEINRERNPELAARLELIRRPVGEDEVTEISLSLQGTGSRLERDACDGVASLPVRTVTIDGEMARRGCPKVDFLKMDIEGSELAALHGAVETLRRFRPKLAICLYHQPSDFLTIPSFLTECDLGYRFYLEHHFVNEWETVLYALPEDRRR